MGKEKGPFKYGFWFGLGLTLGAYIMMFAVEGFIDIALTVFALIMRGLGYSPGVV